jgi:transcriptional regulator with XRE-family HTH domain
MDHMCIRRLESGEHEPSLSTLVRLAGALGEDLIVAIKSNGVRLRQSA